jgi:hypothetical protein
MPISYLRNHPWSHWSREERLFCAVLFQHARRDAEDFAHWLISETALAIPSGGAWDLGFEVCFYRDYLWQLHRSARTERVSPKRTFDLCLFGEESIIIIESKVSEPFDTGQNRYLGDDKDAIPRLIGLASLQVKTVALASSRYFSNAEKYGRPETLAVFDGKLTWLQVAQKYPDPILEQPEVMYKPERGQLLGDAPA